MQPVTDPDVEPVADSDIEPVMVPDIEPVTDPMDDEPPITIGPVNAVDPVNEMDTPHWKSQRLGSTCVHTKQQHVIRTKASRSSTPFELVHSDLCGPMKHSFGGAQYYIIYIDDCTRYTEVYFLITKTAEEISAKFQHCRAGENTGIPRQTFP